MTPPPPRRRTRRVLAVGVAAVVAVAGQLTTVTTAAADDPPDAPRANPSPPTRATASGLYVVTLTGAATATAPATRPAPGRRFDRTRPQVQQLSRRLLAGQDRVLERIGDPAVTYRYTTAVNGFAARLQEAQVKALRTMPEVALVERSVTRRPASDTSGFLGLTGRSGAWAAVGGPSRAGRGTVVGVVDTGIWPQNAAFAGVPQRAPGTSPALPGFHGACAAAEQWSPQDCTDKVVSARWFVDGFGADGLASTELLSPRDSTGHGSHAASIAAGEPDVRAEIDGALFGTRSGVAPAARIAVYKACWTAPDPVDDGCTTADVVAAVDAAVADGVDVLDYSVSGSADPVDSVGRAFLGATSAGVFVAASGGNDGPAPGTVGNTSPWVTTAGASTHLARQGGVLLGDGRMLVGAMAADEPVPATRVVRGQDAALDARSRAAAARCEIGSLDAAVVQDHVVVCERGQTPRVDKSTAVARAGGRAMVLLNTSPGPSDVAADVHAVPTVHLDARRAATLESYLAQAGRAARVALDPDASEDVAVPAVAPFSGRGPTVDGDVLKPDLTAPGVGVLGAVAPPSDSGRLWDLRSGTSASAAHVAGVAALLRTAHPAWSPSRLRSAMVTTAGDLLGPPGAFGTGSGMVQPRRALDPGLVFDVADPAWRSYTAGERSGQDLNLPSVSVPHLVGTTTVVRRLTNVGGRTETYVASVGGVPGVGVRVRPSVLRLAPGETGGVRITLTASAGAATSDFAQGALTWTAASHQVRVPVVVRTDSVGAPGQVVPQRRTGSASVPGRAGSASVPGRSGSGRPVDLRSGGPVTAGDSRLSPRPGSFDVDNPQEDADTLATTVSVPAGTDAVRVEVPRSPGSAASDADLYLYRAGDLVASSQRQAGTAAVTVEDPEPGDYELYVHAALPGGDPTSLRLLTWVVPASGGTPLDVDPPEAPSAPGDRIGRPVSWADLDPTAEWLAVLDDSRSDRHTLLRIR